jgi:hypothetical protein
MCQIGGTTRFMLGDYTSAGMNRLSRYSTAMALGSRPVSARHPLAVASRSLRLRLSIWESALANLRSSDHSLTLVPYSGSVFSVRRKSRLLWRLFPVIEEFVRRDFELMNFKEAEE